MADSSELSSDFVKLPIATVMANAEYHALKLNKLGSLLKKAAVAEENYAKELQKILKEAQQAIEDGGKAPGVVSVTTPSSIIIGAAIDIIATQAKQHTQMAQDVSKHVVEPLKNFKQKGEIVRKQMKDESTSIDKKNKEIRDSIAAERGSCMKMLDTYKQESDPNSAAAKKNKRTVELSSLHKAFMKFETSVTNANEHQKSLFDRESKLMREYQGLEEERIKMMKTFISKYASLVSDVICDPFTSLTMNLDRSLSHFNQIDDIKLVINAIKEKELKARELTLLDYNLPFSPVAVLEGKFDGATPGHSRQRSDVPNASQPPAVPAKHTRQPSDGRPLPPTPISPTGGNNKPAPPAGRPPSSAVAAAVANSPPPVPARAGKPTSAVSPTSSSSSGPDTTLLKVFLPNDTSYTLAAMQCPTVAFIKKKVSAKLTRQGEGGSAAVTADSVMAGTIRIIGLSEDMDEKLPMAALLTKAAPFIVNKTVELEIVVAGIPSPFANRPARAASSSSSSQNNGSDSEGGEELKHATLDRPKPPTGKKKRRAAKAGSGGLVAKFDASATVETIAQQKLDEETDEDGGKEEEK